jgi:sulfur carrier protein ThiS
MSAPTGAELRLIGSLKRYVEGRESVAVEAGQTVRQALAALGVRPEIIALVIVNGAQQPKDYVLKNGDSVDLLAVIGGGSRSSRPHGGLISWLTSLVA